MWYNFFLGETFRPWKQQKKEQAVIDLKTHMMRLERRAPDYDAQGIDVALTAMGFSVEVLHVQRLWSDLKRRTGPDVGHAMEALAEDIADHVDIEERRMILGQLWPAANYKTIPDEKEEAVFDRVASLLGFSDKNFLDSCIKHRVQRNTELSESEVYCVVAELLICMMQANGGKDLHEDEALCRIVGHGFQMDVTLMHRIFATLGRLEARFADDHVDQDIGIDQFERERRVKIDALADVTRLSTQDIERKFHVLIDVPQLDQQNINRKIKLLVEKLRYSLDDYGYEHLLDELQSVTSVDGDAARGADSLFTQVKTLLAAAERNIATE